MNGKSLDIKQETLNKLKEIIPSCFTEDKIDWEKLKVFFEDNIEFKNERYHLNWAGKTDAIRLLQTPTYKTLKPSIEESVNFDTTENLFIEGDNLEVLKILQKSYFGKIKMIYIDPPYNTGNDFIYKDDYSETLAEYRKQVGDVDENGNVTKAGLFKNTKENGHYHSNWLNMMYPRLFLARNLLRDDGVIFVSIDDNEVHNLRLMMDEIFGEENFRNVFAIRRYDKNLNRQFFESGLKTFNVGFEYIVCYSKTDSFIFNPILKESSEERQTFGYWKGFWNDADRPTMRYNLLGVVPESGQWKWSQERANKAVENYKKYLQEFSNSLTLEEYWESTGKKLEFIRKNKEGKGKNKGIEHWIPPSKGILRNTNWTDLFASKNDIVLGELFDYPKNPELIKTLIVGSTENSDLILDFFAGSGTTAHAVMELNKEDGGNRKFILVQLPEPTDPESEAYKAGYKTIADIAKERIRRAANKIHEEFNEQQKKKDEELPLEHTEIKKLDLGFKVFKLDESNFKQWRPFKPENAEQIQKAIIDFTQNVKPEATTENILYELMLKNGKKLTDKIEKKNNFYVINENELVLMLESVDKKTIGEILKLKPQKVIVLDKIFNGKDQLKTNVVLQFKDAGIEFKSV